VFPSPFRYARAGSLDEALSVLDDLHDEVKVLAGGQSLLPLMKLRLAAPEAVLDIGALEALRFVRVEPTELVVGALTCFADLERSSVVAHECQVLGHVAARIGDPQVRHRGTIGGSLSHGDPASDLPALLLALQASLVLTSRRGARVVPASEFFQAFLTTALGDDELLTEVRIPRVRRTFRYEKFTRRAQEWAIVGVATVRDLDAETTRIGLVNLGPTPLRAHQVEAALAAGADPAVAAARVIDDVAPSADTVASAEFRRHLAVTLVRRTLEEIAGESHE
jgi:aerobic carbon-monoxide dehydrogenase medium subunit